MARIITEQELMQHSNQPEPAGVSVFGHVQVADTFLAICAMTIQERRVLAGKLAAYDAQMAGEFAQMIIDAVLFSKHTVPTAVDEEDYDGDRYQLMDEDEQKAFVAR